jgi:hypothetical protein
LGDEGEEDMYHEKTAGEVAQKGPVPVKINIVSIQLSSDLLGG